MEEESEQYFLGRQTTGKTELPVNTIFYKKSLSAEVNKKYM